MAEILADEDLETQINTFTLVVSEGGRFEFSVDGELIFSKKGLGRHAEEGEVIGLLRQKLGTAG
jgi:selenoprotein W-related protein